VARVEAGGNATLLLDFLRHFDGVAVLVSRRRTPSKSEELLNSKSLCDSLNASGDSSDVGKQSLVSREPILASGRTT
jgi:hypothetical protein